MLFNSYTFILFFLIIFMATKSIENYRGRKFLLLFASYLFYITWNPPFVFLLWISTIVDWYAAKWLYSSPDTEGHRRRACLLLSLVTNLGMLGYFKYGNFILENANVIFTQAGLNWQFEKMNITLPIGISFYTFQTLSYTIDIYRKKTRPCNSFLDFALYVTFFPQLVAGPIVRASEFLPQCEKPRRGTGRQVGWGMSLIVVGLFAKVVLADGFAAPTVESVYSSHIQAVGFLTAWTGTLAFAMQIFYDFFGYSTCAVGVALCLGLELPDNFRYPYAARGFSDFWERWHISLSSWLRDYLYVPLGGNRNGIYRTYINLMITMLLGGLWHGASWMFIIWGGLHGIYLIGERLLRSTAVAKSRLWTRIEGQWLLTLLTFSLVCIAWVFFRAESLSSALTISGAMLDMGNAATCIWALVDSGLSAPSPSVEPLWLGFQEYFLIASLTVASLALHQRLRDSSLEDLFESMNPGRRAVLLSLMAYATIISMTGEESAFIYFQF